MIQIGDIIMHSKNGNNNSYNKDDTTNYLNWQKVLNKSSFENKMMEFIRNLIGFRKENKIFTNKDFRKYLTYHYDNSEIAGTENRGYWDNNNDNFFGVLINQEKRIYIASSKSGQNLEFILPKNKENKKWMKIIDTSNFKDITFEEKEEIHKNYILNPHALAIFTES